MTEQTAHQKAGELSREQVAEYLRNNPDFFVDQDELLRSLTLPHDSGRAISLVERQVHLFREQRDTLRRELVELVSIARHNDRLFEKSKRLLLQVIEAKTLNDMAAAVDDSLRGDFGVDAASILVFSDAAPNIRQGQVQGALHVVDAREAQRRLGTLLEGGRAVCGHFHEQERSFLFPDRDEPIASVALMPLRHQGLVGVFAVGSCQQGYFDQNMGSLFLSYISDILSRLLPPMLKQHGAASPVAGLAAESGPV